MVANQIDGRIKLTPSQKAVVAEYLRNNWEGEKEWDTALRRATQTHPLSKAELNQLIGRLLVDRLTRVDAIAIYCLNHLPYTLSERKDGFVNGSKYRSFTAAMAKLAKALPETDPAMLQLDGDCSPVTAYAIMRQAYQIG